MTQPAIPASPQTPAAAANRPGAVYTRAAVDSYLAAVTERRRELQTQIRDAETRAARAELAVGRVEALERSVGELVVGAVARSIDASRTQVDLEVDLVDLDHLVAEPNPVEALG